jgi:small subunit ribosomal protein S16
VADTDARAILRSERIDYWLGVGAQPSEKVAVLIKKYGTNGSHVEAQNAALDKLALPKAIPDPGKPASVPKSDEPAPAEEAAAAADESKAEESATTEQSAAEPATEPTSETPAEETATPE